MGPPDIDRSDGVDLGRALAFPISFVATAIPTSCLLVCRDHLPDPPLGAASDAAPIDCQPSDLSKTVFNALNVQQRPFVRLA
jgi:hypothetical protein